MNWVTARYGSIDLYEQNVARLMLINIGIPALYYAFWFLDHTVFLSGFTFQLGFLAAFLIIQILNYTYHLQTKQKYYADVFWLNFLGFLFFQKLSLFFYFMVPINILFNAVFTEFILYQFPWYNLSSLGRYL
jgi:hypothetical protein